MSHLEKGPFSCCRAFSTTVCLPSIFFLLMQERNEKLDSPPPRQLHCHALYLYVTLGDLNLPSRILRSVSHKCEYVCTQCSSLIFHTLVRCATCTPIYVILEYTSFYTYYILYPRTYKRNIFKCLFFSYLSMKLWNIFVKQMRKNTNTTTRFLGIKTITN
jgi:hypothetical protein